MHSPRTAAAGRIIDSFPADTVLADGDVWVILNDGTNSTLYSAEDADEFLSYPSVVHHNGNDARGLEWTPDSGDTWILIDVIGTPDADPGSGWDVAGESGATANHTLVRKIGVAAGNTDWTSAAGTGAANSEWVVFPEDDFDHLGWHSEAPEPFSVLNPVHGDTISSFDDPLITDQDIGGETVKTLFVNWNKAVDPDPGDTLSYELMISNIYTGGGGPDEPIVTRDTAVFIPLEQEEPWKMNGTYQLYVNACDLTRHVTHSDSVTLTLDFKAPPEIVSADIVLLDGVPKFYAEFNMPIVRDMENYTLIDYSDGGTLLDPTAIDSVAPNAVFLSGDLSEDHWVAMEYSGVVACSDTASTPLTVTDTAWVSNEVLIPFSAAHPEDAAKVIEDFEEGIGSFWTPTGSGSTYGVLESSGFAVSDEAAFEGNKSGKLTLLDDPENNGGWYVRLYHQLGHSVKADSKIMLMVKGSNANVEMRISVKDEAGYEQGPWKSVSLSEDDWQVVSFDLLNDDAEGWVNGDGEFTGETGLIEAIHMRCPEDEDVTLYLDGFTERQILTPVDITLNVIMKKQVADGIFNPASDYVDVTGTFNEWSGTYMGDLDSDTTYTVTIPMMKYSTQEFKFRINGSEDDETVEFPSGGDNRVINVRDYDRSYTYWYNDDTLEVAIDGIPDAFALHQNYPNPFNPTTTINFDLPEASDVKLVIYDISGRKIRTLVDGNNIDAGYKRIVWNGRNDYGNAVSTGMYIYRLQAGAFVDVKKMTFLK
ncbi:MAG: FlgD immunoglobulin-like domain containing protein [Candidatus Marinimicrobia bacterium]|nr:FlgD immunoglobulin-like domain containing protein [Candidatus Neomarinimicrobiota bacterium]